ncbi:MAG: acylneuraminate cytidylyltransferase family protein [Phycisphaerae bacterium]
MGKCGKDAGGQTHVPTLGVIIARSGSKGLPGKHTRMLLDKPLIGYTIESALNSKSLDHIIVTSDDPKVQKIANDYDGVWVVGRPTDLADDKATVDSAARFGTDRAEELYGFRAEVTVLLYGNIPIRPTGLIDMAVRHLLTSGGDSVQSYTPVGKHHPDWMVRLENDDRVVLNCKKAIYRRQDLTPMFIPNGAVLAIRRESLYRKPEHAEDFHCFLGTDRRGIVGPDSDLIVDIDERRDLYMAEAILRFIQENRENASQQAKGLLV